MRAAFALPALFVLLALAGCESSVRDMYRQPRDRPLGESPLFEDGRAARPPVAGTVARSQGYRAGSSSGRFGEQPLPTDVPAPLPLDEHGRPLAAAPADIPPPLDNPRPVTAALLTRGRERYDIYCAPCHSPVGDGDGMIVRRGFPAPPSFHTARLRRAPDGHFFRVITHGYGAMYPYADRVSPDDRWAIVAYIRALQLSQHAPASRLSREDLRWLEEARQ